MTYVDFIKQFEVMTEFTFDELLAFLEVEDTKEKEINAVVNSLLLYTELVKGPVLQGNYHFPNTRETWMEIAKGLMCAISLDMTETNTQAKKGKGAGN